MSRSGLPNILWVYCDELRTDALADPSETRHLADDPALTAVRDDLETRLANHLADSIPVAPAMIHERS